MEKVLIGITVSKEDQDHSYRNHQKYAMCVYGAGGIPVLLPCLSGQNEIRELGVRLDGLLLSGGGDIHPWKYGEDWLDGYLMENPICPERDQFEIDLFHQMLQQKKPILGICRGIQLMTVALGGRIYQDIGMEMNREKQIRHSQAAPDWCPAHQAFLSKDSTLFKIFGEQEVIGVNSFHHQAVSNVPEGYRISAMAEDGVIEAIEAKEQPFCIGIQWHPERMAERNPEARQLFQTFVRECEQSKVF